MKFKHDGEKILEKVYELEEYYLLNVEEFQKHDQCHPKKYVVEKAFQNYLLLLLYTGMEDTENECAY